jgi:Peptidase A4 family
MPHHYCWWEMVPGRSVTVGSTVRPGDLIFASAKVSVPSYILALIDGTNPGNSFPTVQTCLPAGICQNSSAEWIVERPVFPTGITPLSFFFNWSLANARRPRTEPRAASRLARTPPASPGWTLPTPTRWTGSRD